LDFYNEGRKDNRFESCLVTTKCVITEKDNLSNLRKDIKHVSNKQYNWKYFVRIKFIDVKQ